MEVGLHGPTPCPGFVQHVVVKSLLHKNRGIGLLDRSEETSTFECRHQALGIKMSSGAVCGGSFEGQTADRMHSHPDIVPCNALSTRTRPFLIFSDAVKMQPAVTCRGIPQVQEEILMENQHWFTRTAEQPAMTSIAELPKSADAGKAILGTLTGFPRVEPAFTSRLYPASPFSVGKNRRCQEGNLCSSVIVTR